MPLRNRVDPSGEIHAVAARGMFTGNRGVIHDPDSKTLLGRRWSTKAWIICMLRWRDVRRVPMGRNARRGSAGWTELFFLDEVTALAAGHRPCFYCQRERAMAFLHCYGMVAGIARPRAPELDARLHGERRASTAGRQPTGKVLDNRTIAALPEGAVVEADGKAFAFKGGRLLPWSFDGYGTALQIGVLSGLIILITPLTTLDILRAGYKPAWHPTADDSGRRNR